MLEEILYKIEHGIDIGYIEYDWFVSYITALQEENETLKEKLKNKLTAEELVNLLNQELIRQRNDYKTKINKAVEYINAHYLNANEPELLSILQGDDNNER